MVTTRDPRHILRLRATIVGIEPEIWRTIDLDDALTLGQFHHVMQAAIGWRNAHLHRFSDDDPSATPNGLPRIGRRPRAWVDAWSLAELGIDGEEDEADTTLRDAMQFDGPLWYLYDSGDDWLHRIDLIDRDTARPGEPPARVVMGERRAPYEDSGGVPGYHEIAEVLGDPARPEHGTIREWVASAVGSWGDDDLENADLLGAQGELEALFGPASRDLSGLADGTGSIAVDSPIARFAGELDVPVRSNLRRHLRRTGILESTTLPDAMFVDVVAPYSWLIERIGAGGLTLTKAGWMPPAVVWEGMTTLGWREDWIGEANREDLTWPMRTLRASAEGLRLIRRIKGRLEVPARTRRAAGRPGLLAERIGHGLLRQRMTDGQRVASTLLVLGLADGTITTRNEAERHVLRTLGALGWVDRDGRELDGRSYSALVDPVLDILSALGLWREGRRRRDVPPTEALRALARAALR